MRRIPFILFVLINIGLFQSYRCLQNITSEHIEQSISYDEFTSISANSLTNDDDDKIPAQKKKRKRLHITDYHFDLESHYILIFSNPLRLENSFLPEAIYTFSSIYSINERGPPSNVS